MFRFSPRSILVALALTGLASPFASATTLPAAAPLVDGRHYARLQAPQPTENAAKVEVIEFFWYGCPHCADIEPELAAWVKKLPADVSFRKMPAVLGGSWSQGAQLFFTLEAMGLLDKLHVPVFNAIHKEKINLQGDEKAMIAWIVKQGVDREKFLGMYKSFSIVGKTRRAQEMTQEYGFGGVPVLIVGGKYMPLKPATYGDMLRVVDGLIAMNRAELKKK